MVVFVLDNYDSFTYNLVQRLGEIDPALDISVERNDQITPAQIADRFGPSADQTAQVAGWLAAQGLHLDWTAPSRAFVGFSGSAAALGNAFHMQLHSYVVHGQSRMAPNAEPQIPLFVRLSQPFLSASQRHRCAGRVELNPPPMQSSNRTIGRVV